MGKTQILSQSSDPFYDRSEAGRLLSQALESLRGQDVVVLGIPRGGIITAQELATGLGGDLDVILSHKLRTPGQPELAMGAIAEGGITYVDPKIIRMLGIDVQLIEQEKTLQLEELERRALEVRRIRPKIPLKGRKVIITDDGIATGATTLTALRAVRFERPARLILALPVGPSDAVRQLADEADETICLRQPIDFMAVGQFYRVFDQVTDQQMLDILKKAGARKEPK
jgi:putative phosphoribosyl transferase